MTTTSNDTVVLESSLDDYLTPKEVAALLKFKTARPVYAAINAGELEAFDLGGRRRIASGDLLAWLNRNRLRTDELVVEAKPVNQSKRRGGRSAAAALAGA
jgi:excisionase family DNA binding protein